MQRCIFFTVFAFVVYTAAAQRVDITNYLLDFNITNLQTKSIDAKVEISLLADKVDTVALVCGKHLQINAVAWREGRIKGYINFTQNESTIKIALPKARSTSQTVIVISYIINLADENVQSFLIQTEELMAINPSAMFEGIGFGYAGLIFPAIADDEAYVNTNFGHKKNHRTGTVGTTSFYTTQNEQAVGTFWNSERPINPANYFIIVGSFEEFKPKELDKEFGFTEVSTERLLAEKTARDLGTAKTFIESRFKLNLSDTNLTEIDSISKLQLPVFLISQSDFQGASYTLKKAAFVWVAKTDEKLADEAFTDFYTSETSEQQLERLLGEKWGNEKQPSVALLSAYRQRYVQQNTFFIDSLKQQFMSTIDTGSLPFITTSYKYLGGQKQQAIFITQDTALTKTFTFPIQVRMVAKDSLYPLQTAMVTSKPLDTLYFDLGNSPQSVSVNFGVFFPGYVNDQKPDYYALYELSNAESYAQRAAALDQLFNTQNANLYSTVVGIALRDEDKAIRQKALNAAEKVNTVGAYKIKDTLRQLKTTEPQPNLRKQTTALYLKLYGEE